LCRKGTIQNQLTEALLKEIYHIAKEVGVEKRNFSEVHKFIMGGGEEKGELGKKAATRGSMQECALAGKELELDGFIGKLIKLKGETESRFLKNLEVLLEKLNQKAKETKGEGVKDFQEKMLEIIEGAIGENIAEKIANLDVHKISDAAIIVNEGLKITGRT